jgi:DNA polymerase-3 subunit delta
MNSYLIEGLDFTAIKLKENELLKKESFNDSTISIYDLEETMLENALEDLDTYSFLSTKKTIIIKHIEILKYDDEKEHIDHLLKYIDNPSKDNLLIIEAEKLNNTTKLTKELKKRCKYIEIDINSKAFIKQELKDYKASQQVINLIDEYCQNDITKIHNECDKLKNYALEKQEITEDDIKELVIKKQGDQQELVFSFIRSIAEKNIKRALKEYQELINMNIEPIGIIGLLESQLRILLQVKILENKNMTNKEIGNMLQEKEFRIKKTKELIGLYTKQELQELLIKLSDIDLKIKTTDTDPNTEIYLFITNLK